MNRLLTLLLLIALFAVGCGTVALVMRPTVDNVAQTAVTVTHPLSMWQPAGQPIERVIERVIRQDGNVTVFEREVVYLPSPPPEPFETYLSKDAAVTPYERKMLAKWQTGDAVWIGGPGHPSQLGQRVGGANGVK